MNLELFCFHYEITVLWFHSHIRRYYQVTLILSLKRHIRYMYNDTYPIYVQ